MDYLLVILTDLYLRPTQVVGFMVFLRQEDLLGKILGVSLTVIAGHLSIVLLGLAHI